MAYYIKSSLSIGTRLVRPQITRFLSVSSALRIPIQVGDKLPSSTLFEHNPGEKIVTTELFNKGKHIIFGVPGAFTPGCSQTHLPGFIKEHDALTKKGIQSIACISVNDPFVMDAWGKVHKADGKIRMLADVEAEFTKAMGLSIDLTAVLGNHRSKRYAMVVEDGIVKFLHIEPDGTGLTCSLASNIINDL
uniref:Peroxiredoxin-5 n=1 Tax=Sepiella maindroni TaxID=153280 RepID=A0A0H3YJQ4_9MOLL|nr:peroxiredoxin 5 [Sepiella maindroni]